MATILHFLMYKWQHAVDVRKNMTCKKNSKYHIVVTFYFFKHDKLTRWCFHLYKIRQSFQQNCMCIYKHFKHCVKNVVIRIFCNSLFVLKNERPIEGSNLDFFLSWPLQARLDLHKQCPLKPSLHSHISSSIQ